VLHRWAEAYEFEGGHYLVELCASHILLMAN